jgi:radical SAM superfamily enzyme YgiQ (UPF0313 family)
MGICGVKICFVSPPVLEESRFPVILLCTLNAKYIHASFGLRCLMANMGELSPQTQMMEFDINQRPLEIVEKILATAPAIIGLGVYVWNARQTLEVVRMLKQIAPAIPIVLGGPEVSYETGTQEICALADAVISGEGDLKFAEVCRLLLAGTPLPQKLIAAELPDLAALRSPYALYTPEDLAHRLIYVEASRGCPFRCEFCLSSRDIPVRQFPLDQFLAEMDALFQRGARQFKFVDRTFNLHLETTLAILDFFWQRYEPGLFLHFEIVPDRLPEPLREALAKFPPGALQLEAGVQTFNEEAASLIERRQNYPRLEENLRTLREQTHAHLHADLIAGLPGEDYESFAAGFDRLLALRPHEIQVGILKRLRGTSLSRHTEPWGMVYCQEPPYEILCNRLIDFSTMQRVRRFAKYWEHVANSGNFRQSVERLWATAGSSPFHSFMAFSDWAYGILKRTDSVSLSTWARLLLDYLSGVCGQEPEEVRALLLADFESAGRKEVPPFLRGEGAVSARSRTSERLTKRQQRHGG